MLVTMSSKSLFFTLLLLVSISATWSRPLPLPSVDSATTGIRRRTVYSPHIIKPDSGTIWTSGSIAHVVWDASDIPSDACNNLNGKVVLGYLDDGDDDEHLDNGHPLAKGFSLCDGNVKVKVPFVEPRRNYIVALFGDSGNVSPPFCIKSSIK